MVSPGGAMPATTVGPQQDNIRELIDTIRTSGKVPIEINIDGTTTGGTLDVWNRAFDQSFGDLGKQ